MGSALLGPRRIRDTPPELDPGSVHPHPHDRRRNPRRCRTPQPAQGAPALPPNRLAHVHGPATPHDEPIASRAPLLGGSPCSDRIICTSDRAPGPETVAQPAQNRSLFATRCATEPVDQPQGVTPGGGWICLRAAGASRRERRRYWSVLGRLASRVLVETAGPGSTRPSLAES